MAATPQAQLNKDEVRKLVMEARVVASVLAGSDPDLKADLSSNWALRSATTRWNGSSRPPAGRVQRCVSEGGLRR